MPDSHRIQAKPANQTHAVLLGLRVSDSVSSIRAFNVATAAKYEVEEEDHDQAKALSRLRQISAHKGRSGTGRTAASGSLQNEKTQRCIMGAEATSPPVMQRCVCTMYRLPPCHRDPCSPASLGVANSVMKACTLPGLELGSFLVVSGNSLLYHLGISWGFTAMTIALGSSYFQRLCHTVPSLESAAQRHANFAAYAAPRRTGGHDDDLGPGYVNSPEYEYQSREILESVMFACVSIASKNVDRVQHPGVLKYMLSKIYGVPVDADAVYNVESKCLDGLNWQLGPYYVDDALESSWVAWIPG